jgi:DNA-binding protein H-NS
MSSYKQLKAEIVRLEKQAEAARLQEKAGVIAAMRTTIAEFGITAKDLGLVGRAKAGAKKGSKAPPAAKYRNPQTGETWSGMGHAPKWMAGAVKRGRKDDFLIEAAAKTSALPAKSPVKPRSKSKTAPAKAAAAKKTIKGVAKKAAKPTAKKPKKPAAKPAAKRATKSKHRTAKAVAAQPGAVAPT